MIFVFSLLLYIFFAFLFYSWIYISLKMLRETWLTKAVMLKEDKIGLFFRVTILPLFLAFAILALFMITIDAINMISSLISNT